MSTFRPRPGVLLLIAGVTIAAAIAAVAAFGVHTVGNTTTDLYLHPFQVSNAALEARYQITALHRSMRELLLASNPAERKAALEDMSGRWEKAQVNLLQMQRFYLGDFRDVSLALDDLARWEALRLRVVDLALRGRQEEARTLMTGEAGAAFSDLDARISDILVFARSRAADFAGRAARQEARLIPTVVGMSAVLGVLLALVFHSWRRLHRREAHAKQALAVTEERLRAVQEVSLDGFAIFRSVRDASGQIVDFAWEYANAAALAMCRTTPEAVRGRTLGDILPQAMAPDGFFHSHRRVAETGTADVYETYYDGGGITGWFRNMVVKLGDGVAVSIADITDIKRAQLTKSHFLASVSHDLRQPLQALRLFIDVLDGQVEGRGRQAVAGASQALEAAEQLLIALLDVSRLDAGLVEARLRSVELGPLMEQLAEEGRMQADRDGHITFRFQCCSAVVRSDPVLLGRILRNLMHNALRYTGEGRILLGARRLADMVRIEVWDSGPGIPASEIDAIFEDFYQLGNSERDRSQGLGLGLAIVRRTADLLGHQVGVRSWPGRGSVFWITVPVAPSAGSTGGGGDAAL